MAKRGPVVIEHETGEVQVYGKPVHLAPAQYNILKTLVDAGGKIVTRKTLLDRIYSCDSKDLKISERVVDQGVYRVRSSIGKASKFLVTVSQRGYRWVDR